MNLKYIYNIIVLGFIAFIVWLLYDKGIFGFLKTGTSAGFDVGYVNTGKFISTQRARELSAELYSAMNQYGTDYDVIDSVYDEIKNSPGSFKQIASVFGFVKYRWGVHDDLLGDSKSLLGWLKAELPSGSYKKWLELSNH